jgi:small-conductance mechanosensitive channel
MPTNDLMFWVIALSIAFPLTIVLLTELRARLRHETALQLIRITTNSTVPLLALWVLVEKIFDVPRTDTLSKVIQTLCWVSVLNMFLLLVNALLLSRRNNKKTPSKVMLDFVRFVLVLVGTGVVLAFVWNVNLGGVLTTLGVGSLIIGFALQDTLGSIVAGFLTMVRRPFVVGDKVEIGEMQGEVREITWNSVVLRRPDRSLAYIPQSDVAKRTVVNVSRLTGAEHCEVFVEFSKQHPPNNVKRVLMSALWSTPGVEQEPAPLVRTMEHTDINIRYSVRFWTQIGMSPLETKDNFLSRLWYVAKRYDLKCELPTRKFIQTSEQPNNDRLLSQYQEEISTVPLLFKMGGNMLEYVAKGAILHEYASGEHIIREGEMVETLFVIIQGDARALVSDRKGKPRQAFMLKHGEFFGESSLFSGRPCPYSVVALNDLSVVLLDKEMVNRLVESDTKMVKEIGRVISERRERIAEMAVIG